MKYFIMVTDKDGQPVIVRCDAIMIIEPCYDKDNQNGAEITLVNGSVVVVKDKLMDLLLNLASV